MILQEIRVDEERTEFEAWCSQECYVPTRAMWECWKARANRPAQTEQQPVAVTAERDRLQQFEAAYNEWHDKTEWVQKTAKAHELGKHRADVLKDRVDQLQAEVETLRKDAERYRRLRRRRDGQQAQTMARRIRSINRDELAQRLRNDIGANICSRRVALKLSVKSF